METIYRVQNKAGETMLETSLYSVAIRFIWMEDRHELLKMKTDYTYDIPSKKLIVFTLNV